ncbi:MAG: hypothetical protein JWQ76_1514 [Ramlibacter sp.]|nr:hypothetical protein [Ramlibacter sp.]
MVQAIGFPVVRAMWQLLATAGLILALGQALPAKAVQNPTEREFNEAVQQFKNGRRSEAFGRFIALANRGDVDAARIALHLHTYGSLLYSTQWEAGREDIEYWTMLVRNSPTAGRPQAEYPVFVAQPVKAKARTVQVQKVRTVALAN